MYHCHIHFYLIGYQHKIFELIKEMPPLEHFSHEFFESDEPEEGAAARADVILADLHKTDVKHAFQMLVLNKRMDAELILLLNREQILLLSDDLSKVKDIWTLPMSDEEIGFRFLRWQQTCRMSKDCWQINHYLEATINNVPNLIWYKDKEGVHKKVNDSFCKTVNKTKEEVEGRKHAYIWDVEQDDPACIESEQEVMSKKQTCISEEVIKTGDGKRTLTTYKSPLYDLDGSVMGTVGVAIDITQERVYERELIRKNKILETIFTTLDCGVMCHTLDGSKLLSINKAALKILDYESEEELMSEGFHLVAASVVEEDKIKLQNKIKSLKKEGDSVSVEYCVQHRNGDILHIMGSAKLFRENGELFCRRFLLDCTAQKLEEKRNKQYQMELVQALGIDFNIICFFDLDTGVGNPIRNINDNGKILHDIFGDQMSLEHSMEQYIQEFVYEEDKEMLRQFSSADTLKKELAEKKLNYINYRALENGEITYFQIKVVRAGTWSINHGIVMGFRSVDEEIRNEMKQKNLLEDALMQANKANKAKSVFLSNMSHDIRTPMNAIVGFTNLAITHIDNKELIEEYLKKIMTSGNHLLSLINDVLDMSHIESGKIHLEEKPCSLPDILHGLYNILQADIHAKQLELQIDTVDVFDEDIYCDKLRLNQVLLNLLSNSVKYTGAGGMVSMRITEKAGAPKGYANYEFSIRDNGIGMSQEFVEHIFEPFEREKNSTISRIQGTGLGMAITKNIVDMMNGSIHVKSKQGVGTEFTVSFTFRLYTGAKEPQEISELKNCRAKEEEKISKNTEKIREGRILLAEDVELNQEIASAILGDAGFSVEIAGNGKIAAEMVKKSEPGYYRLVLMDVQMPVMNGYEATAAIRALDNKELASIPIIAMTANAFEEDKQEALKCGMNGHIAKPIDIENLLGTLDAIII